MTRQRTFKKLVRSRMAETGESYTAARAALLHATDSRPGSKPVLVTSEEKIRDRTGRGWEEWFDALDTWGAQDRTHREIARWVAEGLGIEPLVWEAQAVTVSYERARKARAVGEHVDGYAVTAQKTVSVPVDQLYEAFLDPSRRRTWGPGFELEVRRVTRPRTAHFDVAGESSRVHVHFDSLADARCRVSVEHARISGPEEADRHRQAWRRALASLATSLMGGGSRA